MRYLAFVTNASGMEFDERFYFVDADADQISAIRKVIAAEMGEPDDIDHQIDDHGDGSFSVDSDWIDVRLIDPGKIKEAK